MEISSYHQKGQSTNYEMQVSQRFNIKRTELSLNRKTIVFSLTSSCNESFTVWSVYVLNSPLHCPQVNSLWGTERVNKTEMLNVLCSVSMILYGSLPPSHIRLQPLQFLLYTSLARPSYPCKPPFWGMLSQNAHSTSGNAALVFEVMLPEAHEQLWNSKVSVYTEPVLCIMKLQHLKYDRSSSEARFIGLYFDDKINVIYFYKWGFHQVPVTSNYYGIPYKIKYTWPSVRCSCEFSHWHSQICIMFIHIMFIYMSDLSRSYIWFFWCNYQMLTIPVLPCGSTEASSDLKNMPHKSMTNHLKKIMYG